MLGYAIRRVALAGLVVWAISVAAFILLRVLAGDPALARLGPGATTEAIAAARTELGLDDPYPDQYGRWATSLLRFDLGVSAVDGASVREEVSRRLPVSLELVALTLAWTAAIGIPAGVLAAHRRGRTPDVVVRLFAVGALAVPTFWVATLVLTLPQRWWGYAPPLDGAVGLLADPGANLRQFVPASLVLAAGPAAALARLTRTAMLEVLGGGFVRTARAKGLGEGAVLFRHALPNALVPAVTVLGVQAGALLGGTIVVEQVFNLGGVGQYLLRAVLQQDDTVAMTLVVLLAAVAVAVHLAVDLSYAVLDPRVRRP
ncbi:MAG: glutathione ABC transporter permease [Chloroflexota bacterium]